jgi:beta-lactamase class A
MASRAVDMIEKAIAGHKGTFSVTAKNMVTGEMIGYNSGLRMPTASTFKVYVLWELMKQAEEGRLSLDDMHVITREDWCCGSGVLRELSPGLTISLRDLAMLMIILSDNLATDLCLGKVGVDNLKATLTSLGLSDTSIPFGCKGILASAVGMPMTNLSYDDMLVVDQRLRGGKIDFGSVAFSHSAENTITSGHNMVTLLEHLHRHEILSPASCDAALHIMGRQQLRQRIPAMLPASAKVMNKTGTLHNIVNDAGLVYPLDGQPYALAIYTQQDEPIDGAPLLARISRAVFDYFAGA